MRYLHSGMGTNDQSVKDEVCARVFDLVSSQSDELAMRSRLRAIMDGGEGAVAALLGDEWARNVDGMPVANMMLSGMTRLAQKLGRLPDIKVDPPAHRDSARAVRRADTKARILESFDQDAKMKMKLPQIGRWLPGYGFSVAVVRQGWNRQRQPFPNVELRDPYETYLGDWGVEQQPDDVAFQRVVNKRWLARRYPQYEKAIEGVAGHSLGMRSGAMFGGIAGDTRWGANGHDAVEVYEYINEDGIWFVLPDAGVVLEFEPNMLENRAPFHAAKRFSFSKLTSQYQHAIGLMAAMARMNLLTIIAAEDSVMAETNIVGEMIGASYERGRDATNFFTPGTSVSKMNQQVPFQVLQQADRLERQLRLVEAYPVTDDSISPNSFVTGRGLDELSSSVDREVREYFTVEEDMFVELDAMRLEFAEKAFGGRQVQISGTQKGAPFSETYTPAKAIGGDYRSRRVFGAMAGFDDATKIITGLQLMQAGLIDTDTMREQIDGLENHSRIKERVAAERAEQTMFSMVDQMVLQGDQRAVNLLIELMSDGPRKAALQEIFAPPEEPEQPPVPEQPLPGPGGGSPNTQTVLSQLTQENGRPGINGGVQTVGRL